MSKIDLSYLNSISGGDSGFILDLLHMFRKNVPADLAMVTKNLAEKDYPMLSSSAHKIKAPVEMLGQPELVKVIGELEKAARENEVQKLPGLVKRVEDMLAELDVEVDQMIHNMQNPSSEA